MQMKSYTRPKLKQALLGMQLVVATLAFNASLAQGQAPVFLPGVTTIAGSGTPSYTGDGGRATSATLGALAFGITTDPAGNIYIADTSNNVIRRVDAVSGIITTFAGTGKLGYSGDGGPASAAQLNGARGVTYFRGSIYIADSANGRIRAVNLSTGIIKTVAGGGSNKISPSSQLTLPGKDQNGNAQGGVSVPGPQSLAFDTFGNMYYSTQSGQPAVGRVTLQQAFPETALYAGSGTNGPNGDGGPANFLGGPGLPPAAQLNGPAGLAIDAQNNLYIYDGGNKAIRLVNFATGIITTYVGGPKAVVCSGASDSVGDGCPGAQATLQGSGHISFDGTGALLIADQTGNRVRRVLPGSNGVAGVISTIVGTGATPSSASGGYAADTATGGVIDVELTPGGDLILLEDSIESVRILRSTPYFSNTAVGSSSSPINVLVQTQAGSGSFTLPSSTEFIGGGAPTCSAGVNLSGTVCSYPVSFQPALAGLRSGPLVFTDANGSVRLGIGGIGLAPAASLLPGLTSTLAGTGVVGSSGDTGAATSAELNAPAAAAFDRQGNLFFVDTTNNEVREVTASGTITGIAGTGTAGSSGDGGPATAATLNAPQGIVVDLAGNLYIADTGNNKIRYIDQLTGIISTFAGTGTAGYSGDFGGALSATFNGPTGLFLTPAGALYVADTGNNVIRTMGVHSPLVSTFVGNGTAGFSGDGGSGPAAELTGPKGVAVDASGNLYIADTGNNRIRELSAQGVMSTLAGQQGGGYTGDGTAASTELNAPAGIAVDSAGTLYIADTLNNRIRVLAGGQIATVVGTGTAAATGDGDTSTLATIGGPLGVALDKLGNVVVVDTGNNKLREVTVGTDSLAFGKENPGSTTPAQLVALYDGGNQALSVASVTFPAGYAAQSVTSGTSCSSAPLSVAIGANCALQIAFSPTTLGNYSGNVTIADNAQSASGATQTIAVTGTGAYVFVPAVSLPANTTSGTAFTGTVTVTNPQATYTGILHFTSTDAKATLPADYTFVAANASQHTFSFTLRTSGPQCVTVTDTSDSTVTATGCTTVAAGAPATITITSGNNQSSNVDTAYPSLLVVFVQDAAGNPVPSAQVTFTAPAASAGVYGTFATPTGAQATNTETTDLSGFASSVSLVAGPSIGSFHVTASVAGASNPVTFNFSIVILGSFTLVPTASQVGPLLPSVSSSETINIVPTGGFVAPVTLTCTAPQGITCTMTPTVVTFVNGKPASQPQLSFQSQGDLSDGGFGTNWVLALIVVLLSLPLLRRRRRFAGWMTLVLCALVLLTSSGCGNNENRPTTSNGSYTVTVNGTTQTVSASTSVTYTVQQ